jgi:transcriptional regulator with XRE-family HTH domain
VPQTKSKLDPEFPKRLKHLREQRAMNIAELARLVKVSPAAIWHWENKGTMPRSGTVEVIAEALGVSRSFLQTGKQPGGEIYNGESRGPEMTKDESSLEELMRAIEAKGFEVIIKSRT